MFRRQFICIVTGLSMLAALPATAIVNVTGTINTRTWIKANSPYVVTGGVIVPLGDTLTIEAGVDVQFNADVRFEVQGSIVAVGTAIDSIRFLNRMGRPEDQWRRYQHASLCAHQRLGR